MPGWLMSVTRRRTFLLRYLFPSVCGSLGVWQMFRWQEKKLILKEAEERMFAAPIEIESFNEMSGKKSLKYRISPKSTSITALLGPRGLGTSYGYTLFEKAILPSGETVVLNRGNLGLNESSSQVPELPETVIVVEDKEERRPLFARKNRPYRILWRDWTVLREALNILPDVPVHFLKVVNGGDRTQSSSNLQVHQLSLDQIPNRHAEYIATWFCLAAFSVAMSFMRK